MDTLNRCIGTAMTILLLGLLPFAGNAQRETVTRQIANGLTYTQEITGGNAPLVANVLRVDLNAPGVKLRTGIALDAISLTGTTKGRETLQTTAKRNKAVAAINADFFPYTGDPLGLAIRDGELISEPMDYRACLGITAAAVRMGVLAPVGSLMLSDGFPLAVLNGINRVPQSGEIVALTPIYAATPALETDAVVMLLRKVNLPVRLSQTMQGTVESVTPLRAGSPLPRCPVDCTLLVAVGKAAPVLPERFLPGDTAQFRFDLVANGSAPSRGRYPARAGTLRPKPAAPLWADVQQAVGGGPWLVRDGQVSVDGEAEGFGKADFIAKRHPRTAVGLTRDNKLLLVTVDGRQAWSQGMSLDEMAGLMKRLGAVNAINLDGGGSSSMFVAGAIVNGPSDGSLRPIADSLLVYADETENNTGTTEWHITPNPANGVLIHVGERVSFKLVDADGKPASPKMPVLWGTERGFGFVTQRGEFTSQHAGSGEILACVGGTQIRVPVSVLTGDPAQIAATFKPVAGNPSDRNLLVVTVRDKFGNPVTGLRVLVNITGGTAQAEWITDANGAAQAEIVWDALPGERKATVRAGNAPPANVRN